MELSNQYEGVIQMNCCKNNHENKPSTSQNEMQSGKGSHKGHMAHIKMMALCCGLPVLLLFLLPLLGYKGFLTGILPFLCPILMVAMMPMMLGMGRKKGDQKSMDQPEVKSIEDRPLS